MYEGNVLNACVATGTAACAATVLPNTGVIANNVVALAAAVLAGMAVWGVLYARANR